MRPKTTIRLLLVCGLALVTACDSGAGNTTPDPDVTAPTVTWTSPDNGSDIRLGDATVMTGTAEDETEVASVVLAAPGIEPAAATLAGDGSWTAELTPVAVGPLQVTATATDAAGNSGSATRGFSVIGAQVTFHVETVGFSAGAAGGAVRLYRVTGGVPDTSDHVPEAIVKVNDTVLPFLDSEPYMNFQGPLDTGEIKAGDTLSLRVEVGEEVVTAQWTIPPQPTVTGPADGAHFAPGETVRVTWDAPSDPSYFLVLLHGDVTGGGWSPRIDGSERHWDVDPARLPADGSEVRVTVRAYSEVTAEEFSGPAADTASVSGMNSTSLLGAPTFTVGP